MFDQKYTLQLTEKQARIISEALDLFSRIGMGQLKEVVSVLRQNPLPNSNLEKRLIFFSKLKKS